MYKEATCRAWTTLASVCIPVDTCVSRRGTGTSLEIGIILASLAITCKARPSFVKMLLMLINCLLRYGLVGYFRLPRGP